MRIRNRNYSDRYLEGLTVVHPTQGRVPFRLYRYQEALLGCDARERLVVKARQVGVSQLLAGEALHQARFFRGRTVLFVSRNLAAAQHLQRMVYQLMADDQWARPVRASETELVLPNESAIRSLPASEETGRTFSASSVYLDEFAHAPWAQAIYQAVVPCLSRGGGLTIVSTPKGKNNLFHQLYQETLLGLRRFQLFTIHWADCPEYNPEGWWLQDREERVRVGERGEWFGRTRPLFGDDEWAEEFDCDFRGSAGLVYREFDQATQVADCPYNPEWPTYAGVDFGYVNPTVALFIQVSPSERVFVIDELYHRYRPISSLAEEVYHQKGQQYQVQGWYCDPADPNGISELRRAGLPAAGARSEVRAGIRMIQRLLKPPGGEEPRLLIGRRCRHLIAEMSSYGYRENSDVPEKDVSDHGPDALRYFVMNHWRLAAETEGIRLRG